MKNKKIAIDVRMWRHPGIGRYIRELIGHFDADRLPGRFVFYGPASVQAELPLGADFKETRSGIYTASEQIELPLKVRSADLFHVPHFNIPVLYRGRMVVTVHDLIYFHAGGSPRSRLTQAYASFLLNAVIRKAAAIITVSEATRQDILQNFPKAKPEKFFVVHEAVSPLFRKTDRLSAAEELKRRHGVQGPFVLFVGSLKAHKNIPTLIQAMQNMRRRGLPHELVIVGRRDEKELALRALIQSQPFVRVLGEISDAELNGVYNAADAFVLPSLREGFGLPLIEAMACGAPALASRAGSLPEIGGAAAHYFEPTDVDGLSDLLYNVLNNKELRETMSRSGLEQSKKFSWNKTASETLSVYRKALAASD